jgi:hypothetical protein
VVSACTEVTGSPWTGTGRVALLETAGMSDGTRHQFKAVILQQGMMMMMMVKLKHALIPSLSEALTFLDVFHDMLVC